MPGLDVKLAAAALLAGAWGALVALPRAMFAQPAFVDALARLVVVLLVLVLLVVGAERAWPALRRAGARGALVFVPSFLVLLLGLLVASGAIVVDAQAARAIGAGVQTRPLFGPLAVWPGLVAALPALDVVFAVSAGRALMMATTAALLAAALSVLVLSRGPRAGLRPGVAAAGAVPVVFAGAACPLCAPPIAAFVAGMAMPGIPALAGLADPTSTISALLDMGAPLFALMALLLALRAPGRRDIARSAPLMAALLAPLLAVPLVRARLHLAMLPEAASDVQETLGDFLVWVLIGALLLIAPVIYLALYYPLRYRASRAAREPQDEPIGRGGRRVFLALVIAVPAVIVFGLGAASLGILWEIEQAPEGTLHVDVVASRWNWTFAMPDGTQTVNELRVPMNEVVVLHVASRDVIHSLYVPQLGVKIDALPGHENDQSFRAIRPGTFDAFCAEFCGVGHTRMRATVIVEGS